MTAEQILADQARVFADFPTEPVHINGVILQCLVMQSTEGSDLALGGFRNEDSHRVAIERGSIALMPVEGQTILFRSKLYDVTRIERDDAGASVVVDIAARVSSQQS